jgi:SanA protein
MCESGYYGQEYMMHIKRYFTVRKILLATIIIVAFAAATIFGCNWYIDHSAKGKVYTESALLPHNHVGLLLGTAKFLGDGQTINPYYQYRIEAAEELLKQNKISYLVISGDNSRKDYNEPEDMRQSLIAMGVDSNRIFLDYAGFRTFDSVVRLREIFGQSKVTIISQAFHNERALFIADMEGIEAVAYNAHDVGKVFGFTVMLREKLARVKVFVDYMTFKQPKFLGPRVQIPA